MLLDPAAPKTKLAATGEEKVVPKHGIDGIYGTKIISLQIR
jgi:hypothetical protein